MCCPPGKTQAFLRDADGNGLRVRVTPTGAKSFVFEQSLRNKTIRRTIGSTDAWTIDAARTEAKRLSMLLDSGVDPRELQLEQDAAKSAEKERIATATEARDAQRIADAVTVRTAWTAYVSDRRELWGERHYLDHLTLAQDGGKPRLRAKVKVTKPGPLATLMDVRLVDLTSAAVESWAKAEAKDRPARTRLALRLLKAFLSHVGAM